MSEVSTFRLYLMRALYLLMFVGQGSLQWPTIIHHTNALTFWHGVGGTLLFAMALLAAYPLKMLPLLLFELVWKSIWLIAIALPLWSAHQMDPDTLEAVPSILMGVIVPIIIPWPYVLANYVKKPGDRWR